MTNSKTLVLVFTCVKTLVSHTRNHNRIREVATSLQVTDSRLLQNEAAAAGPRQVIGSTPHLPVVVQNISHLLFGEAESLGVQRCQLPRRTSSGTTTMGTSPAGSRFWHPPARVPTCQTHHDVKWAFKPSYFAHLCRCRSGSARLVELIKSNKDTTTSYSQRKRAVTTVLSLTSSCAPCFLNGMPELPLVVHLRTCCGAELRPRPENRQVFATDQGRTGH